MHTCPVCNKKMIGKSKKITLIKYARYCPNCGVLLRKKSSPWIMAIMIPFAICVANLKTHWVYCVLAGVFVVLILVLFNKSPYEPYDNNFL